MEKNYSLEEAAKTLKMAAPTFRVYRPQIGGSKIGRRWVFTESELDLFLASKRRKPIPEVKK